MTDSNQTHDPDQRLEDQLRGIRDRVSYPAMGDSADAALARIEQSGLRQNSTSLVAPAALVDWDDDADEDIQSGGILPLPQTEPESWTRRVLRVIAAALAILIVGTALVVLIPNIAGDGEPAAGVLGPETTGYRLAGALGGSIIPNEPVSVALDADGNIYTADIATRSVHKFSPEGEHLDSFTAEESEFGAFIRPWDIAIQDDRIYVLDQRQFAVYAMSLEGNVHDVWRIGDTEDQGNLLTGIDADVQGNVYVVRTNEGTVEVFTANGDHLQDIVVSTDPQSGGGRPADVALAGDGTIYVTTLGGDAVQVFAPDGTRIDAWSNIGIPSQFGGGGFGITVSPSGNIHVSSEQAAVELTPQGEVINTVEIDVPPPTARISPPGNVGIGAAGTVFIAIPDAQQIVGVSADGEVALTISDERADRFASPAGMRVGPEGMLFVSDPIRKQVLELTTDGTSLQSMTWDIDQFVDPRISGAGDVEIAGNRILVLDGMSNYVVGLTTDGHKELEFTGALIGDDPWTRPTSLATDSEQRIYVLDSSAYAIYRYDTKGRFLDMFGQGGVVSGREGIVAMDIVDDTVYVAYAGGSAPGIWSLDVDGNPIEHVVEFQQDSNGNPENVASHFVVAGTGDIFAFVPSTRAIHWYGPDGNLRDAWMINPDQEWTLSFMYLAVDEDGKLYVSDGEFRQILIYEPVS